MKDASLNVTERERVDTDGTADGFRPGPVPIVERDVQEFFGCDHVAFEADGAIFVAGPVEGHFLSVWDIHTVLRHMSARRGVQLCHDLPARRLIGRPCTFPA